MSPPRLDTRITIAVIVSWLTLGASGFIAYGKAIQRTDDLERQLLQLTTDRIHRATVLEMFKVRDVRIEALTEDVQTIRDDVKDLIKLSRTILHTMPRTNGSPESG